MTSRTDAQGAEDASTLPIATSARAIRRNEHTNQRTLEEAPHYQESGPRAEPSGTMEINGESHGAKRVTEMSNAQCDEVFARQVFAFRGLPLP
jgi:hypothetical protein